MGEVYSNAVHTFVWLGLSKSDCRYISVLSDFNNSPAEHWELEAWESSFDEYYEIMKLKASEQITENMKEGFSSPREKLVLTALHDTHSGHPNFPNNLVKQNELWSSLLKTWCRQLNINGFVRRLALSDYWKRAWVIQELVLSKNAVLFCDIDNANVKICCR